MYLQIYIYIHIHIYFFNWKFLQPRYIGPGHGGPNKCTVMCTEGLYRSMVFVGVSKWLTVPATRFHSGITPALSKLCRLGWIMNEISPPPSAGSSPSQLYHAYWSFKWLSLKTIRSLGPPKTDPTGTEYDQEFKQNEKMQFVVPQTFPPSRTTQPVLPATASGGKRVQSGQRFRGQPVLWGCSPHPAVVQHDFSILYMQ